MFYFNYLKTNMKIVTSFFIYAMVFLLNACTNKPATTTNYTSQEIENLVKNQNYSFVARMMQPMSGRSRFVNGNYSLKITPDKIQANLPYIGRAFTAVYGEEAGINFESSDFEYKVSKNKKDDWEIELNPRNNTTVKQLFLTIYTDGNADLRIIPLNKQYISYSGSISPN